jgi:hypothetical protein
MTTTQNYRAGLEAEPWDVARLIVQGLAGQRSEWANIEKWSGRELEAVMLAARELTSLYNTNMLPDALIARAGRARLGASK